MNHSTHLYYQSTRYYFKNAFLSTMLPKVSLLVLLAIFTCLYKIDLVLL